MSTKPRRIDALANRERILDVAEDVFGRGGRSAPTEEVARLAGVGIATVFRHFPTKATLVEAVLVRRFDRLRDRAGDLLGEADAGEAFHGFFRYLVADAATKIAIGEALAELTGTEPGDAVQASLGLRTAFGRLLRRAQDAGAIRDDVELPEVYALVVAAARANVDEEVRGRMLAVMFDGLSPA